MFKVTTIRGLSYLLALAALLLMWWFATDILNDVLDTAEQAARSLAYATAENFGLDSGFVEIILLDKMHADRTLVLGILMLAALILILVTLGMPVVGQLVRVLFALALAHALLTIAWLSFTKETSAWYAAHYEFVKEIFRSYQWHKAETLLLRIGQIHTLLVLGEVLVLITAFGWSFFSIRKR